MLNTQLRHSDLTTPISLLSDNRSKGYDLDIMWDKLNLSQQYAVCSLGQFGYLLTYVRLVGDQTLAILKQSCKVATINEAGVININPSVELRQEH
jgi:hypothetical protein